MKRYFELFTIQLKAATLLSLQYRVDFFVQAVMALFWSATALAPLLVLFSMRDGVAGWSAPEALLVVGLFMVALFLIVRVLDRARRDVTRIAIDEPLTSADVLAE